VFQFRARTDDGQHFTLPINGERRTYTNDKEGRRQAILDGLEAIETVAVGQDVYLPSNAALQVVAAVLYPDGIQTEEAYRLVCQVTEKACAHLGYGPEEELGPPHVPFTARGAYRKRYPPVDPQLVLDELELAGTSSYLSPPRGQPAQPLEQSRLGDLRQAPERPDGSPASPDPGPGGRHCRRRRLGVR
jgi:hypothetical protein